MPIAGNGRTSCGHGTLVDGINTLRCAFQHHDEVICQGPLTFAPALNDINSGVGGKERLVRQAGSELLDVEGPVQTGVKLLAIGEKADLESLASE